MQHHNSAQNGHARTITSTPILWLGEEIGRHAIASCSCGRSCAEATMSEAAESLEQMHAEVDA